MPYLDCRRNPKRRREHRRGTSVAGHVKIDAVVSGINVGLNASLGFIIASGTIAGAWKGALHGLPAIAFSQDVTSELYDELKAAGDIPNAELREILKFRVEYRRLAPDFAAATLPRSFVVHIVNFPHPCLLETKCAARYRRAWSCLTSCAADDGTHRLIFRLGDDFSPPEPLTDRAALATGFISHTVLDYKKIGQ